MIAKGFGSDALRHEMAKTSEGRLLVNIFVQAIYDLSKKQNARERANYVRRKAYVWLTNDSYMLDLCCWLLNINIDELRDNLNNREFIQHMQDNIYKYYIGRKKFEVADEEDDFLDEFDEGDDFDE